MELMNDILAVDVIVSNRMRSDMGDLDALAKSIQENGLINPITLTLSPTGHVTLVAGHRRFESLKKLGVTSLEHGVHFLWREDLADDEYRRTAVELEENIRRKQMNWSEEVLGKQRLLQVYEKIYGTPKPGQPQLLVQQGLKPAGFGVRKLADLLNESAGKTSQDLEMAALVQKFPILRTEPTAEAAKRKLELAMKIHLGQSVVPAAKPLIYKIIITCDSEDHQLNVLTILKGMGLTCQPLVA